MNEAETRIVLIDNELIKCGWDIKDITKVIQEYPIELYSSKLKKLVLL